MPQRLLSFMLLLVLPLAHAEQIPLTIGGTTIQFPMESDYVRVSDTQPKVFDLVQAALPATNRLVEVLVTRADMTRLEQGGATAGIYYEIQVQREIEPRQISIDDWNALKPQLTAGMSQDELDKALATNSGSNDRLSAVAGKQVGVTFGKVSAPTIYRQTPLSVSFWMLVPIQMRVGNDVTNATTATVGSFAMVRNKLIFIYGYSTNASSDSVARLRSHVNDIVDQTIALNPSDTAVRSTGAFDWSQVGKSAAIGGIIGLLLWFFRRRKE
ncbi:MAG TPA: hypothetical protein VK660_04075 [Xanthomonadaceae bacterium]|jgi:hypothetical protein|nr:hypothetical protein [Xanthomonadaceae bacterium]